MWWAIATLLIGLLPLILNLLAVTIAPQLGCLVIEHGAYTRLTPPDEYYGTDLRPGCTVGGFDIGSVLHAMLMAGLGIVFTWPVLIGSLFLWLQLIIRRRRRTASSER